MRLTGTSPSTRALRSHVRPTLVAITLVLLASACVGGSARDPVAGSSAAAPAPVAGPATPGTSSEEVKQADATQAPVEYPDAIARRMRRLANEPRPVEDSALPPRQLDAERFPTSLIPRDQIVSGGPPPDGIPAIDDPRFAAANAIDWLDDDEAVLVLRVDDQVKIYPVQVMIWHEIVNDRIAGTPVAVTYCPLCNSAVAFDRTVEDRTLDFGTSGALYQSAMVMYDRQTESLWTHFDGRAVVGTLVGATLPRLPVATVSWRDARRAHPDAQVLTRQTGNERPYGDNPYTAYDSLDGPLGGFFVGDPDARTQAMRRVVGFGGADDAVAIATDLLAVEGVLDVERGVRPVTVWHAPGTASALDATTVADGDDVGATGVFDARLDGDLLTFTRDGRRFVDDRTNSRWNILGEAIAGPLAGRRLQPLPHLDTFWFAWATYRPGTVLIE